MTSILFLIETLFMKSLQMQLSKKEKCFFQYFSASFEFRLNFEYFEKNMTLRADAVPELQTPKDAVR